VKTNEAPARWLLEPDSAETRRASRGISGLFPPLTKTFNLWARLLTIVQSLGVNGNSERGLDTGAESLGVGETDDTGVVTGVGSVHARSAFRSRG
jgi:hypothetical protein